VNDTPAQPRPQGLGIALVSLMTLLTGHVSGSLAFTTGIELTYPPWLIWDVVVAWAESV
jgi:hypothetical protein